MNLASRHWLSAILLAVLALLPSSASAGMTPEEVKAFEAYKAKADQGHAQAQYVLGLCYENGDDVVKDQVGPIIWPHKTAGKAQFNLGVVKDEVEAAKWYRKAADQGHLKSQYFIGLRYKAGIGVAKDEVEAYAYLSLAGTAVKAAREELASLEAGISPDARLRGQQRAKQLQEEVEAKIAANIASKHSGR